MSVCEEFKETRQPSVQRRGSPRIGDRAPEAGKPQEVHELCGYDLVELPRVEIERNKMTEQ